MFEDPDVQIRITCDENKIINFGTNHTSSPELTTLRPFMVAMHAFLTQPVCLSLNTPWAGTARMTTVRLRSVLITIEPSVGGSKKIGPATNEREAKEESRNLGNKPSDGTGPIRSYSYCAFPPLLCLVSVLHCGEISNVIPCVG